MRASNTYTNEVISYFSFTDINAQPSKQTTCVIINVTLTLNGMSTSKQLVLSLAAMNYISIVEIGNWLCDNAIFGLISKQCADLINVLCIYSQSMTSIVHMAVLKMRNNI